MVTRFEEDELNIWDDDVNPDVEKKVRQALMNAIKPHKITPRKGTAAAAAVMEKVINKDIYQQIERFIEDWSGDVYVIPGELYSLYKKYCEENYEECLIPTTKAFGRRLSRYTDNGKIKRVVQNGVPYYIKSIALKAEQPEEIVSGKKRKALDSEDDSAEESIDRPKKKKRLNGLVTWSSVKETEEFTLKISELESQIVSLMDICNKQKELITRLSGGTQ
jgi:hypothetical protein